MQWFAAAPLAALQAAGMMEAEVGSAAVLLYNLHGDLYATSAICPHHAAWLSQGGVSGDCIDCPRHQGRFHIPTGRKLRGPECPDLRTYPTRVQDGQVFVGIRSAQP